LTPPPSWFKTIRFDAIVLDTTFLCLRWSPFFHRWKRYLRWIGDCTCTKIALPQDEYDHSEILDEWLNEMQVSALFSCFPAETCRVLYPTMHRKAALYKCFTGYIHASTAERIAGRLLPIKHREKDIVYRARHLPYWFGRHGQLKHEIAAVVGSRCPQHGLRCDISTRDEDVIVGEGWLDFLASGRAVIGCESGSSALDRRGEIKALIAGFLAGSPSMSFEEVSRRLPEGWDDFQFYAISPRHFEAVVTKTCQVLVEGDYEGVLKPDVHFIPLRRDFSNVDAVLEKLKDHSAMQEMVDRAYEDIFLSRKYTYQAFAQAIEAAVVKHSHHGKNRLRVLDESLWVLAGLASDISRQITPVGCKLYQGLPAVRKWLKRSSGKER
jgi:hypothetical protein